MRTRSALVPLLLVATPTLVTAQDAAAPAEPAATDSNWPSFRGHRARGVAGGAAAPTEWDVETSKNVLWRVPVPGLAHSSPVVWGDRLFVTTAVRVDAEAELSSLYGSPGYGAGESVPVEGVHGFVVYCLDKRTGEVLWEKVAHEGVPKIKRHPKSTHANPTPATDGERVVAFFGSEGLYCYDMEGELQWKKDLGVLDAGAPGRTDPKYQWGFASSPILHEGRVIVQCDVQAQSFVACFDAESGDEVWRTPREEDPTWCTPTVHEVSGADGGQVICNGYKHIGGYDLETGEELWMLTGGGDVPVPTPVVADGLIYLTSSHGRMRPIYAIREAAYGLVSLAEDDENMAWFHRTKGIYMQTLLPYEGLLYACSDGGVLGCYDMKTGEEIYRERLGSGRTGFSGSAVVSGGHIYLTGEDGSVHVVRPGREFAVVATNSLGENCLSTPAVSGGALYFRTRHHVVAIGSTD